MATKNAGVSYVTQDVEGLRAPFINVVYPRKVGKKGQEKGDPVFSVNLLLKHNSADHKALKLLIAQLAREVWPGRPLSELKFPLDSGDERAKAAEANGKEGSFWKGHAVFTARSGEAFPPALAIRENGKIVELAGTQVEMIGKQKFYNGCYVGVSVWLKPFFKGSEGGIGEFSGIKAYLGSVCWLKDGPKIGGASATDIFKGYAGKVSSEDPTAADDEIPF